MKKNFLFFIVLFLGLLFNLSVFAEGEVVGTEIITTENKEPAVLSLELEVDVPKTCEVVDTDGLPHTYTASSDDSYLGICALSAILKNGVVLNIGLSSEYEDMGLFVVSFNDVVADSSSQYWALYQNNQFSMSGISTLPVVAGDTISFKLSDFSGVETGDYVNIAIRSLIKETVEGGGDTKETKDNFSLEKAISFLSANQLENGSFGEDLYTDWVAIGLAKLGLDNEEISDKIKNYLKKDKLDTSLVTESERRAMALMAFGIDPKDGASEDYIQDIVSSFDGKQIGDTDLINDDIFALIVLSHAGFDKNNEMIKKIVSFVVSNQSESGSWGSVDMTSATIEALRNFKKLEGASSAISLGEKYILSEQKNDGSFGNVYSTSWATQALSPNTSLDEYTDKAIIYLKNLQKDDGSFDDGDINNKIWSTAYAIPAIYKLSWNDILEDFSYESEERSSGVSGSVVNIETKEDEQVEQKYEPLILNEGNADILVETIEPEKEEIAPIIVQKNTNFSNKKEKENIVAIEKKEDIINGDSLQASAVLAFPKDEARGFWGTISNLLSQLWDLVLKVFI